jgi:hypothetical protein
MLYKITLEGNGAEVMIGPIDNSQYAYWHKKTKAELIEALNGESESDEIPEEAWIADRYQFMDTFCSSGVYVDSFDLTIEEVDPEDEDADDIYLNFDDFDDLLDAIEDRTEERIKYSSEHEKYLCSVAEESGILIEEEIDINEKFDLSKLSIMVATLADGSQLITGVIYDGVTLTEYTDHFEKSGHMDASIYTQ